MDDFWLRVDECKKLKAQGLTQKQIANQLGVSRSEISHWSRFATLNPMVKALLKVHRFKSSYIRHIVTLKEPQIQMQLIRLAAQNHWSVRKLEMEVKHLKEKKDGLFSVIDKSYQDIGKAVNQKTGLMVVVKERPGHKEEGLVAIVFKSKIELASILEKLAYQ
ncbi:ParB/RepB/Spo0J family partition protein [Spartinivicinus poritis]|uniref:Helix-turn-helix domain-containing protein n=1 Tax=Spartinivicinus poritis TaxID=2994640 RepID=A0ABT5UE81_9GAMM|nr:helix-turn-helix domain-containing protein [Spartinivicinus sp. A2-2]MDE1464677.1 helix-turn-helix domain-containing protein [Spartinivicinus sp. A2-2]